MAAKMIPPGTIKIDGATHELIKISSPIDHDGVLRIREIQLEYWDSNSKSRKTIDIQLARPLIVRTGACA